MKLPGLVRRLRVMLDWTLDLFFPRDITQIQTMKPAQLRVNHYKPGEIIISKGEIGRELFIIKRGEVEIFDPAHNATLEKLIARIRKGEVFGEKALLDDTPHGASARAVTAVDVLVMSRADFRAMVDHFPALDAYFDHLMRERFPDALPPHVPLIDKMAKTVPMLPTYRGWRVRAGL